VAISQCETLKLHQCCMKQLKQRQEGEQQHRRIRRGRRRAITNQMYRTQTLVTRPNGTMAHYSARSHQPIPYGGYQPINERTAPGNGQFAPVHSFQTNFSRGFAVPTSSVKKIML
jgi:hypothetical protein